MNRPSKFIVVVLILSLIGSVLEIWGGSWDITSHLLGAPESFFTPPHAILYSGVSISLIAAVFAGVLLLGNKKLHNISSSISFGLKLILIGSIIQIFAGPSDYVWHEVFGVDGLLSPTHLTLITGILIQSVGIVLGLTRLIRYDFKIVKPATAVSFSALWFVIIAYIFQFTLPISKGETINLNPDPYIAGVILLVTMPFFSALIFWGAAKSMKTFGWASAVVALLIFFNITANLIPAEALFGYLPWYVIPMIAAVIADGLVTKKIRVKKFGETMSGILIGSVFLMYGMPLVGMVFIQFYVFHGVSGYLLLPEFAGTLAVILGILSIPGGIIGAVAVKVAKRKISIPVETAL